MSKNTRNRILLTALAALLLVAISVGGTVAYLKASTNAITNTFTTAGITLELKETKKPDGTEVADGVTDWTAKLIPGKDYDKNPKVKITNDVDAYLFVKIEDTTDSVLSYTNNLTAEGQGWTALGDSYAGIYYREVAADATTKEWELIGGNKVTVKSNLVKETAVTGTDTVAMPSGNVTIKYTAYACQKEGFNAADGKTAPQVAWDTNFGTTSTTD